MNLSEDGLFQELSLEFYYDHGEYSDFFRFTLSDLSDILTDKRVLQWTSTDE